MMNNINTKLDWVAYNPLTDTYDTPDGTKVSAELVDNVNCIADILNISNIRDEQRLNRISVCQDH